MLLVMKLKVAITAAALASPVALTIAPVTSGNHRSADYAFTEIAARPFQYRVAGDFSRDGKPAEAPLREARLSGHIKIMTSQVTSREYARCVDDGGCLRVSHASAISDRPMVGVSWRDATAYAEWITSKTGVLHRLPTDEEWVFAAGEKARDEALPLVDPVDPAQAWIARYEAEANRARPVALDPQPAGTFGTQRERPQRHRRQCLGMDQHLFPADVAATGRGDAGHQHQLRRSRRARRAPDLHDRLHPRSPYRRLRRRRAAGQSRLPAGDRG